MSNVPVVQGVAVDGKYYQAADNGVAAVTDTAELRQNPIKKCQDVFWAILFYAHLGVMAFVITAGLQSGGYEAGGRSYNGIIFLTFVTGLTSLGLSVGAYSFMMSNAELLVQISLIFTVILSLLVAILGFMSGSILMGIIGLFSFAVGVCYAKIVWPRIPFAAANLKTALSAVRVNMGLNIYSLGFTVLAFFWTVAWSMGVGSYLSQNSLVVVFLLFLSFYWVHQVLTNTMHTITAGVVGTWWWVPEEASSFCSSALQGSAVRALTYSFGSICFGSFLVAIVQALRALEEHTRQSDDLQILSCIIQCILACIQGIIECLNRFAYVYVALYGFSYLEAGRNVIQLFQNRGWNAIVADNLTENVLFMMALAIGLFSGLVGAVLGYMDADMFAEFGYENSAWPAFGVGTLAGFLFSSIIMSVVGSAVNTVIVCYAEDPRAFETNHPVLSAQMRETWTQAWPGVFNY